MLFSIQRGKMYGTRNARADANERPSYGQHDKNCRQRAFRDPRHLQHGARDTVLRSACGSTESSFKNSREYETAYGSNVSPLADAAPIKFKRRRCNWSVAQRREFLSPDKWHREQSDPLVEDV